MSPTASAGRPDQGELRRAARREQRQVRRVESRRRRRIRRSFLWRHRRSLYVLAVLMVASVTGAGAVVSRIPLPEADIPPQTSYLCAANITTQCGPLNALAAFSAEQDRELVTFAQIPKVLVEAVIAAEDRDFFSHGGVDPSGIARAAWRDVKGQGSLQGGSTITQQYVKNAFLTQDRTLLRKLREAVLAVKLERQLTKEQILERYLNHIYFGRGAYGVAAASWAYFGHDLSSLKLHEAAYLAGLIRSPETADYADEVAEADFRLRSVLTAMVEEQMVTPAEAEAAAAVPYMSFVVGRRDRSGMGKVLREECGTKYVVDFVRQQLLADPVLGKGLYTQGYRIYTSLDLDKQCEAYNVLYNETLDDPAGPDAALVSVDASGHLVSMVGGRNYDLSQVNLAAGQQGGGSGRQPGSSFKPFVLAAAIQAGISPQSRFPAPDKLVVKGADDGADWEVSNYASSSTGATALTLLEATKVSSNTVYAQLMMKVGPEKVADLAHQLGVTADLPAIPALVLGTAEVSVLDMASAYSTLAAKGLHYAPAAIVRVEDGSGHKVWEPTSQPRPVLTEEQADQVTAALRDVILDGTGVKARVDLDAAGKTGTTEDARDAWFVGYTCNLTTAVWMGYSGRNDEAVRPMRNILGVREVTGGSIPATMWSAYTNRVTNGQPDCSLGPSRPQWTGTVLNANLTLGPSTTTTTTAVGGTSTSTSSSAGPSSSTATSAATVTTAAPTTQRPAATTTTAATTTSTTTPPSTTGATTTTTAGGGAAGVGDKEGPLTTTTTSGARGTPGG